MLRSIAVLSIFVISFAAAQTTQPPIGGIVVPDNLWFPISLFIGWLVKELTSPLTSLLKKYFKFEGNVTRVIYVVLSAIAVIAYGLFTGTYGDLHQGWYSALTALVTAIITGFGGYATKKQAVIDASTQINVSPTPVVPAQTSGEETLK